MSREYVSSVQNKTELGFIALSTNVFESIVELSLEDNPDVKICLPSMMHHPISCTVKNSLLELSVEVIIKAGCNINETSEKILNDIRYAIKQMTGYSNIRIDLKVRGFYL